MNYIRKSQKGYIDGGYHFFYLEDQKEMFFDYHYHTFHKCLIILEGDIKYVVEGREYHLTKDSIIWIPSFEAHKIQVSGKVKYKRIVVYLSEELMALISPSLHKSIKNMGKIYDNSVQMTREASYVLQQIFNECSFTIQETSGVDQALNKFLEFMNWMNIYFQMIRKQEKDNSNSNIKNFKHLAAMEKAIIYIKEHKREELKIDDIANHLFLSKYYFMRKFKEEVGITVHQYIIAQRLVDARNLMKQGESLTTIAYTVGFKDYSTFSRAFKKTYHKSPREFQQLTPTTEFE